MNLSRFSKFAVFNVFFTVLVILWGAVVRATGSGAGCFDHWPKCDGALIPAQFKSVEMQIEFIHRATSGMALLFTVVLGVWAFRQFAKGQAVRKAAGWSVFLMIVECLLGAALVLNKWVANDDSMNRTYVLALHHCNTALLLAALSFTAFYAINPTKATDQGLKLKGQGATAGLLVIGFVALLGAIVSGAITALGDTLFPPESTIHTIQQALNANAHFLERFRVLHPPISIAASLFLIMALPLVAQWRDDARIKKLVQMISGTVVIQVVLGFVNVALKAPMWMAIVHLFVADVIWVMLCCVAALALDKKWVRPVEAEDVDAERPKMNFGEAVRAYVALTKPRVISLLLFTTLAAMFIAQGGVPPFWMLVWVGLGGYMMAGAANAINMVIDSDIDVRMKRTSTRPTVTHAISPTSALIFALILGTLSFTMITLAANVLSAVLAFCGLLFYVFIYTLLLKRRTWQNIVIGGAAGAFPPLVGYAAVSGELSLLAWFLFGLIFFWTPVHFWALALLIKDEYAEVGVPMLPVVKGERATVIQITAYAVLTAVLSAMPLVMQELGWIYMTFAGLLNLLLVFRSWQLMQEPDRPKAVRLFKYSMVYLALVFVVIAIDRALVTPRTAPAATAVQVEVSDHPKNQRKNYAATL